METLLSGKPLQPVLLFFVETGARLVWISKNWIEIDISL
jgi:hypothetical protein